MVFINFYPINFMPFGHSISLMDGAEDGGNNENVNMPAQGQANGPVAPIPNIPNTNVVVNNNNTNVNIDVNNLPTAGAAALGAKIGIKIAESVPSVPVKVAVVTATSLGVAAAAAVANQIFINGNNNNGNQGNQLLNGIISSINNSSIDFSQLFNHPVNNLNLFPLSLLPQVDLLITAIIILLFVFFNIFISLELKKYNIKNILSKYFNVENYRVSRFIVWYINKYINA